jgi:hypothetical protein
VALNSGNWSSPQFAEIRCAFVAALVDRIEPLFYHIDFSCSFDVLGGHPIRQNRSHGVESPAHDIRIPDTYYEIVDIRDFIAYPRYLTDAPLRRI